MLRFLRKRENMKKIMWALAILIIPAFVLWGSGSAVRSRGLPKYAGKIFGKKISFRQYDESLLACRNQALLLYGDKLNAVAQYLDLEQEAWERLILLYQSKKERTKVSDKEVISFIQKLPFFQKQGRFDQDKYNTLLDYAFRVSPRDFEEQIRALLKIDELRSKVTRSVSLTDEEIEKLYKKENEQAKVVYVLIKVQEFTEQIHPAYEQLQDYYSSKKKEFKKPEQVNVQYIGLFFERSREEVSVSEEEMLNYYSSHPDEFSVKDGKEKESTRAFEEVKEQIKEKLTQDKLEALLEDKIWQISDEIGESPESFAEVAKKNQLEVQETDFFSSQQVIPEIGLSYEFLNAAFSLKVGEVSNIIETPKGYFIVRVKEKRQAHLPELEEIKEEVERAFVKQKSWQLAQNKGKDILPQLKELMEEKELTFQKAAEKLNLEVKETEEFSRFSYISGIGQSLEFTQGAFELEPGEVSELIGVPNGYCILSLQEVFPIDEEKFAQEKEEFTQRVLTREKGAFYKVWFDNLKKEANLVSNMEKIRERRIP